MGSGFFDVVFDGPPGKVSGRFVEVENAAGHSIGSVGEWVDRGDGTWALRIDATHPLERMLREQRELQLVMPPAGRDPAELEGEDRTSFISWNVLALTDELHELLDEVGWKPWATSRHVNEDRALAELVDAWHFMMNLLWAVAGRGVLGDAGVLAAVLEARYQDKRAVNEQRQVDGYDGVTGKCPRCHRDLAESDCTPLACEED